MNKHQAFDHEHEPVKTGIDEGVEDGLDDCDYGDGDNDGKGCHSLPIL